eukprot:m.385146 g.385146  ORF g.385146 m.385146 type:complete len:94 (-) comp56278_c0_seq11:193-474(-)
MPSTLWIWDLSKLRVAAILQQVSPIRAAVWHPFRDIVAVATSSAKLYFWCISGAYCVDVPYSGDCPLSVSPVRKCDLSFSCRCDERLTGATLT